MTQQETHLAQFSKRLTQILEQELEKGNRIVETSEGWPKPQTIMVMLDKPFSGDYQQPGLLYTDVSDPHYWKADYLDEENWHVLACKFGDWWA